MFSIIRTVLCYHTAVRGIKSEVLGRMPSCGVMFNVSKASEHFHLCFVCVHLKCNVHIVKKNCLKLLFYYLYMLFFHS